jgi:hypothetical protein
MERLSISLNEKSVNILKKYQEKYDTSQADIIRRALNYFETMEKVTEKTSLDNIVSFAELLADREHLIIDIAHWKSFFIEIGEGSKKFWDDVYKIGDFHRKEYADRGLLEPDKILKYMEKTNWFTLKQDSKNNFTLILAVSESAKFIKTFFQGFFNNYQKKVNIQEEYMKIRISFST